MRLLTNQGGKQRAAQQQEEAEWTCSSAARPAPAAEKSEQPMLVGLDGDWVGSREQRGGMEGKVAVVCSRREDLPLPSYSSTFSWSQRGPRHPPRQRQRLVERRLVATFGPSQQLGHQAKAAAQTLGGDPSRPLVVLADGAKWIKQEQARHFPQATRIAVLGASVREVSAAIRVAAHAKLLGDARTRLPIAPAPVLTVAGRGGSSGARIVCLGNGTKRRAAGDPLESDHLVFRTNDRGLVPMSTGASLAIRWAAA